MKTVHIRHVELGAGLPKIAVPLVAENADGLKQALADLQGLSFDVVEFRVDFLKQAADADYVMAQTEMVRAALPDVPLLFTFRRAEEGGCCPCRAEYYVELLGRAAQSGLIDILDIELFAGDETVAALVGLAQANGVAALLCNHDFEQTPPKAEIVCRLQKMEALGADICKIAVMPQTAADVLVLLDATQEVLQTALRPVVTMSMGKLGVISRLSGGTFGSAMTFGAAKQASAPGQIAANELRRILDVLG
ncbi:type I 3-dehydroquinate dehydratase [Neisseria animalis]|uniref:3-dehydroquinate dehydratase n=1 Tax=Neisseria animalis TaxID=492 RepID=A0A5P3MNN8_NEIAN|nr:type I 3-dehydroquinate dehydratase [Neisseria animalis]QEY23088.1 type I 3-dehydroquinate dehydratase [Neisseria animalis]ROW32421.1 type I 3-dehydroquinate dehydratase [Neisseria animalis]VEE08105.1 3-dehydroquinate dehydratase [Neisseria animalis]